jgi:hypothetical protein
MITVPPERRAKPIDLRESEARALVHLFGGEERLEDARQNIRRDPAAGVGDAQRDMVAGKAVRDVSRLQRDVLGGDRQSAALGHRVAR